MEGKINYEWEEAISPLKEEIQLLKAEVKMLKEDRVSPYLSRADLSKMLGCSIRFIQDNPVFKSIEKRLGGRIFYLRDDVDMIIRQSHINRGVYND
ncbi:MAG: hypothetical protein R2879_00515 [Saprospiraceae bacterium]